MTDQQILNHSPKSQLTQSQLTHGLTTYLKSRTAARWNKRSAEVDAVLSSLLLVHNEWSSALHRCVSAMDTCAMRIDLGHVVGDEGEDDWRVVPNNLWCQKRICPICAMRSSIRTVARFQDACVPTFLDQNGRLLFLTLTVQNTPIDLLRTRTHQMAEGWDRLTRTRWWKRHVIGSVRRLEVTRGGDGSAHPHYHCLIWVPPKYFHRTENIYRPTADWVQAWRSAARLDYDPIVDVRATQATIKDTLEVLKYTSKPSDLTPDPHWTSTFYEQMYNIRCLSFGGRFLHLWRNSTPYEPPIYAETKGFLWGGSYNQIHHELPTKNHPKNHQKCESYSQEYQVKENTFRRASLKRWIPGQKGGRISRLQARQRPRPSSERSRSLS